MKTVMLFNCPSCNRQYEGDWDQNGQAAECGTCRHQFNIEGHDAAPAIVSTKTIPDATQEEVTVAAEKIEGDANMISVLGYTLLIIGIIIGFMVGSGYGDSAGLHGEMIIASAITLWLMTRFFCRLAKIHAAIVRLRK